MESPCSNANCAQNESLTELLVEPAEDHLAELKLSLMCATAFVGAVGNAIAFSVILSTSDLRCRISYTFLLNLCLVDFTACALLLPWTATNWYLSDDSLEGSLCLTNAFLNTLLGFASLLNIAVISVDRFFSISDPMEYAATLTYGKALSVLAGVWCLAFSLAISPAFGWNEYHFQRGSSRCYYIWDDPRTYVGGSYVCVVVLTTFLLPGIVMLVMYSNMYRVVGRCNNNQVQPIFSISQAVPIVNNVVSMRKTSENPENGIGIGPPEEGTLHETAGPTAHVRASHASLLSSMSGDFATSINCPCFPSHKKAARTLCVIMGEFLICWTPLHAVYLYTTFCSSVLWERQTFEITTTWLTYLYFAANPLVYGCLNRQLREAFVECLKSAVRRCKGEKDGEEEGMDYDRPLPGEDFLQFLDRTSCTDPAPAQTSVRIVSGDRESDSAGNLRRHGRPATVPPTAAAIKTKLPNSPDSTLY